ncbi:TetR/AcrR family transcriptional regulator [Brevibacillus borstelensis]|uniref:TetR/AcrR family transcriptional regulator n=1 Tax=Brevibacillus borstelensis TaxID=45462 RepID=UPI0030C15C96
MKPSASDSPSFRLLLETTEACIREKGCKKTTLQEIMNRSGLSKGAIYHYVRSKDELFGLILKSKLEGLSHSFYQTAYEKKDLHHPMEVIASSVRPFTSPDDVTTPIFLYLLSQQDQESVRNILEDVYRFSEQTSVKWIELGQEAGVIPAHVDARKAVQRFITFSYGLRVRSVISPEEMEEAIADYYELMKRELMNANI